MVLLESRWTDQDRRGFLILVKRSALTVHDLSSVNIQSPDGQQYIREGHSRRLAALEPYQTLRKKVFHDAWAQRFLKNMLQKRGTLSTLAYPDLYFAPDLVETGGLPQDYLERAEMGVRFIVKKSRKRNREDLLGNLRSGVSVAGTFEIMLAWAMVSHFGEDKVEPYPRIGPDTDKTVDFAVTGGERRLLIEAMVLLEDQESGAQSRACIEHGIPVVLYKKTGAELTERLLNACCAKVNQRELDDPLILCVKQVSPFPRPDEGVEAMGNLIASAVWDKTSKLIAGAYFYSDYLVNTSFAEQRARDLAIGSDFPGQVRLALCRLPG